MDTEETDRDRVREEEDAAAEQAGKIGGEGGAENGEADEVESTETEGDTAGPEGG